MFDVFYHVAPLLPTNQNDEQQIYKKRHIGNDNVHIIWNDNIFDYDTTTITSQFNDAHIVISPLNKTDKFFRVSIYKKEEAYQFGPLQMETLVSLKALPSLVRWTSIFSNIAVRNAQTSNNLVPCQFFQMQMKEIRKIHKETNN